MGFPDLRTLFGVQTNTASPPASATPPINPAAVPNPNAQGTPGNLNPAGLTIQADPNNATAPAGSSADPVGAQSPMDQFKDLFTIDPNAKTPEVAPLNPLSAADPKQFFDAAKKIDFTRVITPDLRAKIAAGGELGVEAMIQAMNQVSQVVYARGTQASSQINDVVANAVQEAIVKQIPDLLKKHNLSQSTFAENPALANPAMKPLVDMAQAQILVKHPNASEGELRKMTSDYFDAMARSITPANSTSQKGARTPSTDWESFFQG